MAAQVDVPAEHIAQGRASPGFDSSPGRDERLRLVRIHSSKDKTGRALRGDSLPELWFWIDDRDLKTKRSFAFMMMLFTLAETGEKRKPASYHHTGAVISYQLSITLVTVNPSTARSGATCFEMDCFSAAASVRAFAARPRCCPFSRQ